MKNRKFITKVLVVLAACFMFASFSPSLDGRAVVVESGVFPQGLFAKTVGYLPGDIISVANISGETTIDLLVIGALDPSEGVAIMLSPEAADAIGIDKDANNIVKITKRSGQDERVYGTAIIAKQNPSKAENDFEPLINEEAEEAFEPEPAKEAFVEEIFAEEESAFEEEIPEGETLEEETVEPEEEFFEEEAEDEFDEEADDEEAEEADIEEEFEEETIEEETAEEEIPAAVFEEEEEALPEEAVDEEVPEMEEDLEEEAVEEETLEELEEEFDEESVEEQFEEDTEEEEAAEESEDMIALPFVEEDEETEDEIAEETVEEYVEAENIEPLPETYAEEAVDEEIPELPEETVEETEEIAEDFDDEDEIDAIIEAELEDLEESEDYEEYEAIVLVPVESNPPVNEVEEQEEAEVVVEETESEVAAEEDEIEDVDENAPIIIEPITASEPVVNNTVKEPETPKTVAKQGSYEKYMVGSLSDLKSGKYYIQIATLSTDENIMDIVNKYGNNYPITIVPMSGGIRKQVLIGPLSMDEYAVVLERFKSYGYKDAFLRKIK